MSVAVNVADTMVPGRENRGVTVENAAEAEKSARHIFDFEVNVAHSEKQMVEETSDIS